MLALIIVRMINSRIDIDGPLAGTGKVNVHFSRIVKRRDHLRSLGVARRIILN